VVYLQHLNQILGIVPDMDYDSAFLASISFR
jgi:hypothetical protein